MSFVINDLTDIDHSDFNGGLTGCLPRREPVGGLPFAQVAQFDPIPWEEIPDRIADQERNQSSLYHIWKDSKIGVLNQNPYLWCWAFSSVAGLMLERELQGLPYIPLSPSSVAGPVVGYQNKGWYIEDALKWMIDHGAASTEYVPATTTNRGTFKTGWQTSAACNKVSKWDDVGNDAQRQISMLLSNKPLVVAHNWWGHAILHLRVLDRYPKMPANNPMRYGRQFLNSWGPSYGDGGIGILEGQRAIADTSYAIAQASFAG